MSKKSDVGINKYITTNKHKSVWMKILIALVLLVVFVTIYMLILPTITAEGADSIDIQDDVTSYWFYYNNGTDAEDPWVKIQGTDIDPAEVIPGSAVLKLQIAYQDVSIAALQNANYTATFTVPALMTTNSLTADSYDGDNNKNGTISCVDNLVTIAFDSEWVDGKADDGITEIMGSFSVDGAVNAGVLEDDNTGDIIINNVSMNVKFSDDTIAQMGKLTIQKSDAVFVTDANGNDFLEYSITVSTGDKAMPGVFVEDNFLRKDTKTDADLAYIAEYVGVSETDTTINSNDPAVSPVEEEISDNPSAVPGSVKIVPVTDTPGTLVWTIGKMPANSVRKLTYHIRLNDGYAGGSSKGNIVNKAAVSSSITNASGETEVFLRGDAETTFMPSVGASMRKVGYQLVENDDGSASVTYLIDVWALETNTYTLKNFEVLDYLRDSTNSSYSATWNNYADFTDIHIYDGSLSYESNKALQSTYGPDTSNATEVENWNSFNDGNNPVITTNNTYGEHAQIYIGDLEAGKHKTVVYTLQISADFFRSGNGAKDLVNRAEIYTNDGARLNGYNCGFAIQRNNWTRKVAGDKLTEDTDVAIPANSTVYAFDTDKNIALASSVPTSFTVPANSFKYQVVVNENGALDVSKATMTDCLDANYLAYSGYLRVDAYTVSPDNLPSGTTDSAVINSLASVGSLEKTVWLNIDNRSTFSFKFEELGSDPGSTYAYILTYYAKPIQSSDIDIKANNSFAIFGSVGSGGSYYNVDVSVDVSVTVVSDNTINVDKNGWYYTPTGSSELPWSGYGGAFWVIEIDANKIPTTLKLRDTMVGALYRMLPQDTIMDQIFGVYKGALPDGESITDYENLDAFRSSDTAAELQELDKTEYLTLERPSNLICDITFNKEIRLNKAIGEKLYILIGLMTSASNVPKSKAPKYYTNKLSVGSTDSTSFEEVASADVVGDINNGVYKEAYAAYTYDGTKYNCYKSIIDDDNTAIRQTNNSEMVPYYLDCDAITENGAYIEWVATINYNNRIDGSAVMSDVLPEGLELTYVRFLTVGVSNSYGDDPPVSIEIAELENNPEWEKYNTSDCIYYYNAATREIRWAVDGLKYDKNTNSLKNNKGKYLVEFQIVTKVIDPEIILSDKNLDGCTNTLNVTPEGWATPITDTAEIEELDVCTIQKTDNYSTDHLTQYPFEITLNPCNEDLMPDSDTLTIVDELSSTLVLDTSTIQVVDANNNPVKGWIASMQENDDGGHILTISNLPDEKKLKITYNTSLNAAPGQAVNITNNAHWAGYSTQSAAAYLHAGFSYSISASSSGEIIPVLHLIKLDGNDTSIFLQGAKFKIEKLNTTNTNNVITYDEDNATVIADDLTTNEDGEIIYNETAVDKLEPNIVYRVTETAPPLGYVSSNKSYLFAVAEGITDTTSGKTAYPIFPDGVSVQYSGVEYMLTVYNYKGEIAVNKTFSDPAGNVTTPPSTTCTFGLYTTAVPTIGTKPLQTLTITYSDEQEPVYTLNGIPQDEPKFTDLTVGETFYVYELNNNGNPIPDNGNNIAGANMFFIVNYSSGNGATPVNSTTISSIDIVNTVCYTTELPNAGGVGIYFYQTAGLAAIIAAAAIYLIYYVKRRKKKTGIY